MYLSNSEGSQAFKNLVSRLRISPLKITDFITNKTLGTGTFGTVKEAVFKKNMSFEFALKIVKKSHIKKLNQLPLIENEKRILSIISHPFIVNSIAQFEDDDSFYFLFEKAEGGELFSLLTKTKGFSFSTGQFYISEILLALRYLHINDIIYRDLKPENVLLDGNGHAKLIDFGFAKIIENNRTYTLCGTPEYIAPELLCNKGKGYDKGVDWWALGVFIYELYVG